MKVVLPEDVVFVLLKHASVHQNLYEQFIHNRLRGISSVWNPVKKYILKTFKTYWKTTKQKIHDKLIQLKEEKALLTCFLIVVRKQPELYLTHCIVNYKFCVVPKSFFSPDGEFLLSKNKAGLLHGIS